MMQPMHDPEHGEDDQLWLGWKWFEFHAKQRLETFKFFLAIFGALITVASGFIQTPHLFVTVVSSALALVASIIFWQMDRRSLQLVDIGEDIILARWATLQFPDGLNPVSRARTHHEDGIRFRIVFLAVSIAAALSAFAMLVWAVYLMNYPQTVVVPTMH